MLSKLLKTFSIRQLHGHQLRAFQFHVGSICATRRWLSCQSITANLNLYTEKPRQLMSDKNSLRFVALNSFDHEIVPTFHLIYLYRLRQPETNGKTLVLMMSWLLAKPKYFEKYCSIYTDMGFDVLVVSTQVYQVMKPKNGSQVVAGSVLQFLKSNECYNQILIHGFSVGGYNWGECLVQLHDDDYQNYQSIADRIKGQVWDSVAGLSEIPVGVSKTIFPHQKLMQSSTQFCLQFYFTLLHESATNQYERSEHNFHHKAIKAPALIFFSSTDQIGTEKKSREIIADFEAQNIAVTYKCFDDSPHVGHFQKYKGDYLKLLKSHLEACNLICTTK